MPREILGSQHENRESLKHSGVRLAVYRPQRMLTNEEIESWGVRTGSGSLLTAERIMKRVGAERRYIARDDETVVEMGAKAFDSLKVKPSDIDAVLFSTSHPTGGNSAEEFAKELEIDVDTSSTRDFHFACSGFAQMLSYVDKNRQEYLGKNIAFVSAEKYSPTLIDLRDPDALEKDPTLSSTIFTDGAAVMVGRFGSDFDVLYSHELPLPSGLSGMIKMPIEREKMTGNYEFFPVPFAHNFYQNGEGVYTTVRNMVPQEIEESIINAGLEMKDVDLVVPHQGSVHVVRNGIQLRLRELGLDDKVVFDNEEGNMSSASIPKALARAAREGKSGSGKIAVLVGFGAGLYSSTAVVKFN